MKDKDRLYIAMRQETERFQWGESNPFHWMLLTGPKNESGNNVRGNRVTTIEGNAVEWKVVTDLKCREPFLARFMIAKIRDMDLLKRAIDEVRIPTTGTSEDWLKAVLERLNSLSGRGMPLGTHTNLDWGESLYKRIHEYLEDKVQTGVLKKGQEGQEEYEFEAEEHWPAGKPRPAMNLLENREMYDGK